MSSPSSPSVADIGDRHRRYSVLAIFSLGLSYTAQTAGHLLDPALEGWVDVATLVTAAGVFVAFVPIGLWKIRNRSTTEWRVYRGEDGFVHHTLRQAKMGPGSPRCWSSSSWSPSPSVWRPSPPSSPWT